jgi:hypothetical protein
MKQFSGDPDLYSSDEHYCCGIRARSPLSICLTASSQFLVAIAMVRSSPYSSIHRRSFDSATEILIVESGRPGLSNPGTGGA